MEKKRPSFLALLVWGFVVTWQESGWAKLWLCLSVLGAVFLFDTGYLLAAAELRAAAITSVFALGAGVLATVTARLHRRYNDEGAWMPFMFWKKRGGR